MAPTPTKRKRERKFFSPEELAICQFWQVKYVAMYLGVCRDTIIDRVRLLIEDGKWSECVHYLVVTNREWKRKKRPKPNRSFRINKDFLKDIMEAL
jgi:hypothetical protein